MRRTLLLPSLGLLMLMVGCSTPKYTFHVQVTNAGDKPLTAGLVKWTPPSSGLRASVEDGWAAPEDVAINAPALSGRHWGVLIAPGETKVLGPQEGAFRSGVTAALRLYSGDHTVDELISYGRTDPDRLDVPLMPGESIFAVSNRSGKLVAAPR